MNRSIDVFIDRKVVVLHENDEVMDATRAMCSGKIGSVVVTDEYGHISGIVTDRDIVCNLITEDLEAHIPLKKIMETDLVFLREDSTIEQAVELMKENGIRRLPILEETKKGRQRCVGMVTLDDLIAGEFLSGKDLAAIVKSQIMRRKRISRKSGKSESRLDQKYHTFIRQLAGHIGLDKDAGEAVTRLIAGAIVRRLHYTGGAHFIAQLPKRLQEDLLDLPAGPDREVTANDVVQSVSRQTDEGIETARRMVFDFWQKLSQMIADGEAGHVIDQLPLDMKELFTGSAGGRERMKAG